MSGPLDGWTALVVAKAPVAGLAKTRLAAGVGEQAAADLAAAALLDTLDAAGHAVRRVVAMTGDLDSAERSAELRGALAGWTVVPQRGDGFDERLAAAHLDAARVAPGPVVQVGMDTPQVTPALLDEVAAGLLRHDAVLGPADDGGWWVLALRDPAAADCLRGVPMSTDGTYDATRAALVAAGLDVGAAVELSDVDTVDDADRVARSAPATRFGRGWLDRVVAQ
ncbi:TIGR04282 family arsenosugar biosynthesis glycosyltransferase [Nocardioides litoris]|uniref:TIGR04282 family arsenosugar biosynthesis glycosyltransferase n=1 Tax=Nocardioides litoris TaxID=1926648 RepID=UPI00111F29CC|nr:DUF2064 domain-containing protein [Nocardioides litoris]